MLILLVFTVYVESVEVTGCQVRPSDKKSEFIIQVTWSDGQVTETCRTYQQLHYFHSEVSVAVLINIFLVFVKAADKKNCIITCSLGILTISILFFLAKIL